MGDAISLITLNSMAETAWMASKLTPSHKYL
jgi:hypothetical protein